MTTSRKISFPYDRALNEIAFQYADRTDLTSFAIPVPERTRTLDFTMQEKAANRILQFPADARSVKPIPFTIGIWDTLPATLGVLDPYKLGTLDDMSIDFKMYESVNELIFSDVLGQGSGDIFEFEEPVHFPFGYRDTPYGMLFPLDRRFMAENWYIGTKPLYLYLWNTDRGIKAAALVEKGADGKLNVLRLLSHNPPLVSTLWAEAKSIMGMPNSLLECDPLTLGALDPLLLGNLDYSVAAMMRIGAKSAVLVSGIPVSGSYENMRIGAENVTPWSEIHSAGTQIIGGIVSGGARRTTLGDLDNHTIAMVDLRTLGMKTFNKVEAILTTD